MLAKREIVDAAPKLPFGKTTPQIPLHTGCGLIMLLGHLGEQLHDDPGNGRRDIL